jgi:hypothetical protein
MIIDQLSIINLKCTMPILNSPPFTRNREYGSLVLALLQISIIIQRIPLDILIESQYLPCIRYFSKFNFYDRIIIHDTEYFEKQSYRNRATIAGANGIIDLIVPVYNSRARLPIKEIKIDNHGPWKGQHWKSIKSAYGKTPFFEHYAEKLKAVYEKPQTLLFDFNLELMLILLKTFKIEASRLLLLSEVNNANYLEYKDKIHPKPKFFTDDPVFQGYRYQQAFEQKLGFIPNLSIIDYLFNEGASEIPV